MLSSLEKTSSVVGVLISVYLIILSIQSFTIMPILLWVLSGMIILAWFNRYMFEDLTELEFTDTSFIVVICLIIGPMFPMILWYEHRLKIKWYAKIKHRGYLVPTRKNRENHFAKLLSGEMTEYSLHKE